MKGLVATLLVLGVARAALADEPAAPPPIAAPPLPLPVAPPVGFSPAEVIVKPPPPPAGAAPLVAGVMTAFLPFVAGCGLWASGTDKLEKAGSVVMVTGFAAAPWVSHGLQHRWKRAAVLGGLSTALAAATIIAMEAKDPFVTEYANRQRVPFGVLLTSTMFAAGAGLLDSFLLAPAEPR